MTDHSTDRHIIPKGKIVDGYEILDLVGVGGFGGIYKVKDSKDEIYGMKTESLDSNRRTLPIESDILKQLKGEYFPKYIASGTNEEFGINYLVMTYLGASIGEIQTYHDYQLDIEVVYNVCLQMLKAIKSFHSFDFVHRDIKPNNFLIRKDPNSPLVLIDFGLSKKHIDPSTNEPYPCEDETRFVGTRKYSSTHVLKVKSCGRKDDLISWFYSFLDLACGSLPWDEIKDNDECISIKKKFKVADLKYKFPAEFEEINDYLKTLKYKDVPDYDHIQKLFEAGMENDLVFVGQFDWNKFLDEHSNLIKFEKEVTKVTLDFINDRNRKEKEKEKRIEKRREEKREEKEKKEHCLIC